MIVLTRLRNRHIGFAFDDFLREEGCLEEATEIALQRIAEQSQVPETTADVGGGPRLNLRRCVFNCEGRVGDGFKLCLISDGIVCIKGLVHEYIKDLYVARGGALSVQVIEAIDDKMLMVDSEASRIIGKLFRESQFTPTGREVLEVLEPALIGLAEKILGSVMRKRPMGRGG